MADEDDDFGDFGGFEAAEPSDTVVTATVPAIPSPWAVFTPAPSGAEAQTNTTTINNPNIKVDDNVQSEDIQDHGSSLPSAVTADSGNIGRIPVHTGSDSEDKIKTIEIESKDNEVSQTLTEGKSPADKWLENLDFPTTAPTQLKNEGPTTITEATLPPGDDLYKERLQASVEEKKKLEQELDILRERQISMETDLEKTQQELKSQKDKYEELQVKHLTDLETMRKSGMDALAVIVEEYKELCKVTVIEQKLVCEQHLKEKLHEITEQCQKTMEEQHLKLQSALEEQRSNQEAVLAEALSNQQQLQQSSFEAILEEEKKSVRDVVSKALQEQKEHNTKIVVQSIATLKEESKNISQEQKSWLLEVMVEKLESMKSSVNCELEKKQKDSESVLKEAVEKDGEKAREQITQFSEQIKEEMMDFIREQKKADGVVRQRQLSSLQLFLESANSQVTDLLSTVSKDNQHTL